MYFFFFFFFFNDTATTEIYTLSLHDALPISRRGSSTKTTEVFESRQSYRNCSVWPKRLGLDRSEEHTLNSSHEWISYAVFCLKKKKKKKNKRYKKQTTHT